MSFVETGLPCPCGKSSDAYAINDKGWGTCFSCSKSFPPEKEKEMPDDISVDVDVKSRVVTKPQRGLILETCKKWGIQTKVVGEDDHAIGFVFPNGAIKQRFFTEDKKGRFVWKKNDRGEIGDEPYGWWLRKGPGRVQTLVMTEGLIDAPSLDQMIGDEADVIGLDSASTVYKQIRDRLEDVNAYKRIVLAFDTDPQGEKAVANVLPLFQDLTKVYRMKFNGCKDANELLQKDPKAILREFKSLSKVSSTSFLHTFTEVSESLTERPNEIVATYPQKELNTLLRGLVRGRATVWKGLEGIGKTELFRFVEHHILKTTDAKVAVIHMEEDEAYTIKGMATYEAERPMYFEEDGVQKEEILEYYRRAVKDEDRFFIYKVQSSDNPDDILVSIRTLVATTGVDVVFLDNLQKMVDGYEEENVRQKLVYLSAKLKDMAKELNFALEVISHVNDEGKALSSRYITKVLDRSVHMDRAITSLDEIEKGTTYFTIEKNRGGRGTGKAGSMWFNPATNTLEANDATV